MSFSEDYTAFSLVRESGISMDFCWVTRVLTREWRLRRVWSSGAQSSGLTLASVGLRHELRDRETQCGANTRDNNIIISHK